MKIKPKGFKRSKKNGAMDLEAQNMSIKARFRFVHFFPDFYEIPLLELGLSCDNLLCDALGRAPSAKLSLAFRNNRSVPFWRKLAQTEVAEVRTLQMSL